MKSFKDLFSGESKYKNDSFDTDTYYAMIRASICTGEKVAGFKNKKTGHFTEIMLIRSKKDEEEFKKRYKVKDLKTEY